MDLIIIHSNKMTDFFSKAKFYHLFTDSKACLFEFLMNYSRTTENTTTEQLKKNDAAKQQIQ